MLSRPPYKSESGLPSGISHGNQTAGKVLRPRRPYPFPSLTQGLRPRTPAPQTPEGLNTLRPGPTLAARPAFEDEAVQADSGGLGAEPPGTGWDG
ncbi:hypothetical protein GCM10010306_016110 [Streptomyces umbrinus]|nr:hypothetical protein GCM10010306_016110 [Streptomyces umbrinus]